MTRPDFLTLEAMPGRPDVRLVNGSWMDREEYDMCGWFVAGEYPGSNGPVRYWMATLEGLHRYGALVHQRNEEHKAARWARREEDDAWSSHVSSLIEREEPA